MNIQKEPNLDELTARQRNRFNFLLAVIVLSAAAYGLSVLVFGLPLFEISPLYHGAWVLGVSMVAAVVLAFSSLGLSRALLSLAGLTARQSEVDALVGELELRFERFEQEFGDLGPTDADTNSPHQTGQAGPSGSRTDTAAE